MAQNDKKLCLPLSISQEAYIIILRFLVHMRKWYLQQFFLFFFSFFLFFQNSDFFGFLGDGVKGLKMTHNYQFQYVTL